jgi:hypothetical protein
VEGEKCENLFPLTTIPRWLKVDKPQSRQQCFVLEFSGEYGAIRYELIVEQDEKLARSRVFSESLTVQERPLFTFQEGRVQLFRDNHGKASEYTYDWNRSALGSVLPGRDHRRLVWFKEHVRAVECLRIDPQRMAARSEREAARPERDLANFPSWYRRVLVSQVSEGPAFLGAIRDVVAGMQSLDLHELGQGIMILRGAFARPRGVGAKGLGKDARTFWLSFDELSDGQRALIALYALLYFMVREGATLCIDEPDNFVALTEIQPWLLSLEDRVVDRDAQVLIASHHPELINQLANRTGLVVERAEAGPASVRPFAPAADTTLTPAEIVARGWERA